MIETTTTSQEARMSTNTAHVASPTNESEKARQAAIIATRGVKAEGSAITVFPRFTAFVLGSDCRDIHPNGHITQDNAAACGTDRALEAMITFPGTIDPEAVEAALTVEIRTFDRFWCGRDEHPFGHGTAQAATHGAKSAKKTAKAAIKVVVGGTAQPAPQRTAPPAPAGPTTPNANKPASRKLRSGAEGTAKRAS